MMIVDGFSYVVCMLVCCYLICSGSARADGPTEIVDRLKTPLINAGIGLDDDSLINTLTNKDTFLASRAAFMLGARQAKPAVADALTLAASAEDESLAFSAMQSLEKLGTQSWSSLATNRLSRIKDRALQIQLASLLAKTGLVEGWDVVAAAILDTNYSSLALENVDAFDNKIRKNGERIDVPVELRKLSVNASQGVREKLDAKLKTIGSKSP